MDFLAQLATGFIGLFQAGGETFVGLVTGILPLLIVLMTAVNSLIKIIGEDRVERAAKFSSKNFILRYTVLPVLAMFFLTNPMAYTFGRFVEEKHKAAFYDSAVSFCHPITGLFPHANPGELFVYLGIAAGLTTLGLPLGDLAVRYFIAGVLVILLRGIVTERIYAVMASKKENAEVK
ncbi:PTS glucitol/sorbitol transporter subunit IIC [Acetobacterium wieringae]|uniref:PTS glucitol/sorbitol transporter subunit IIC n=1 Tax=Acetobacterium wieringae TaxID=52694 RepID=A0ABY6HHS6_9FIRM|nr:PTS glucitol/sorbitol transporter subunit IIC [Acetobacterium wieringae]UYO63444.1 PTS glucitol/sorbitol transporter subunit IIC [Acetobacterium wieringae]VUZ27154.1 PTS system glucitol/sorbitol-specific EIIC component [Acetobacterium wieringae]